MEMTVGAAALSIWIVAGSCLMAALGWRVLNWLWVKPKRLEKRLREQGLAGNSYRLFVGDTKENAAMLRQAISNPMDSSSHDVAPRLVPFIHKTIQKYGKNSFTWVGPRPKVNIMECEKIKIVFSQINEIQKPNSNPLVKLLADGLFNKEEHKWVQHRKIINPAFHLEKLKDMVPAFLESCNEMISKWEEKVCTNGGQCELDVLPYLQTLAADVISRTAFGSSYEEAKRIFQLQKELSHLVLQVILGVYIPGWRFLPTKTNKKMKAIEKEVRALFLDFIKKRKGVIKEGKSKTNDLLSILMESNSNEILQRENNVTMGMSIQDVIEECKLFYFAGQETTAVLLVWTMVLLSSYPEWQDRARAEVVEVFGNNNKPDFDGLGRLKVVTMILNEVLRLYPPVATVDRLVRKETRLGQLTLPAGVMLSIPVVLIHHDRELWGEDAHEFKPERFSEGVSKATKNQASFFPFGGGPRICIGLNFAMIEVKMALSMILQRFSFELSPSYTHSPASFITTQPQHGAHIILRRL